MINLLRITHYTIFRVIQVISLERMMNTLSILSVNVFGFQKLRDADIRNLEDNEAKKTIFHEIIMKYNPDLLFLQEDIYILGKCQYPPKYHKIVGQPTNEGLMNTILIREDLLDYVYSPHTQQLATNSCLENQRCASTIMYKNFYICNLHLSGGRVDDAYFKKIVYLRDEQVRPYVNCDILAGDWNSNPNDDKVPVTHPVFLSANAEDKDMFITYFKSGHRQLLEKGMVEVLVDQPTDIFGGNPDHIYYDPKKFCIIEAKVIDMITSDLSDHNGIFVVLGILNE